MFLLWRSWTAFTALIASVLCVLAVLSVLQHNAVLSDLIRQRLSVAVQSVATSFGTIVDLGMPLSMMRNAGSVLDRAKALDPNITAIHVFNPSGVIVHSTEKDPPSPLPAADLNLQRDSKTGKWSTETETLFKSYVSIVDDQGEIVGGVQALYPKLEFNQTVRAVTLRVLGAAAALLAVFSALALIILRVRLFGAIRGAKMLQNWHQLAQSRQQTEDQTETVDHDFADLQQQLQAADQNFSDLTQRLKSFGPDTAVEDEAARPPRSKPQVIMTALPETSLAKTFARQLVPFAIGLILASTLSLGFVTYQSVNDSFQPELSKRTELIAHIANADLQRGVSAGIPLESMVGMDTYFADLLANFPEISFFGVATGKIIFKAGNWQHSLLQAKGMQQDLPLYPITSGGEDIGYLIISPNNNYVALQFREVLLDLAVVIFVVLLLAYEIMVVVMSLSLTAPLNRLRHLVDLQARGDFSSQVRSRPGSVIERLNNILSARVSEIHHLYDKATGHLARSTDPNAKSGELRALADKFKIGTKGHKILAFSYMNDVRLPLFLFAAADELPLSFFPLFTRAAENPLTWLDPAVVISLPLAGYLLAYMIAAPFSRSLSERFGHRTLLLYALVPVFLSNLALFYASSVVEIIGFRTLAGAGYALAVLACQDYVIDVVPKNLRTKSLGIFSAALFGGIFAGTALGGVLADRFGTSAVFLVSAILVILAGLLFHRLIPPGRRAGAEEAETLSFKLIGASFKHRGFFAIAIGLAVPQSIMDQVFISYLFSLQLDALNASAADIARMLMVYFLMIMLSGSLLGRLTALRINNPAIVTVGSLLTGLTLLLAAFVPTQWAMLLAAMGTGFGHGLVRGPQVDMAMHLSETSLSHLGSNSVLGALRLVERGGSILGLLVLAMITGYFGISAAIGTIGLTILIGMLLYGTQVTSTTFSTLKTKKGQNP